MTTPAWQSVLDFWFLPAGAPGHGQSRREWFAIDPAFDGQVRSRFGEAIETALAGGLTAWNAEASGALARILLLDQFTRNAFRGTPLAFAGDEQALAGAATLVATAAEAVLSPRQRGFVYMPFEHAEDGAAQERSVALFSALAAEHPEMADSLAYAVRHRDIVARFGRFPHRNRILGRESTAAEEKFLQRPGSGF